MVVSAVLLAAGAVGVDSRRGRSRLLLMRQRIRQANSAAKLRSQIREGMKVASSPCNVF